jgi:hypothetical protein
MALQDETFEKAIKGKRWLKCETWRQFGPTSSTKLLTKLKT